METIPARLCSLAAYREKSASHSAPTSPVLSPQAKESFWERTTSPIPSFHNHINMIQPPEKWAATHKNLPRWPCTVSNVHYLTEEANKQLAAVFRNTQDILIYGFHYKSQTG